MVGWLLLLTILVSMWVGRLANLRIADSQTYSSVFYLLTLLSVLLLADATVGRRIRAFQARIGVRVPEEALSEQDGELHGRLRVFRFVCTVLLVSGGLAAICLDAPELLMARLFRVRHVVLTEWGLTTIPLIAFWSLVGVLLSDWLMVRVASGRVELPSHPKPRAMGRRGRRVCGVVMLGLATVSFLGLGYHGSVSTEGITVREGWLSQPVFRSWRDVKDIEPIVSTAFHTRGGQTTIYVSYRLAFAGGATWEPDFERTPAAEANGDAAVSYVQSMIQGAHHRKSR